MAHTLSLGHGPKPQAAQPDNLDPDLSLSFSGFQAAAIPYTLRPLIRSPFDACYTGERFPGPRGREADTKNRRQANGCTPTAGILDDQVAMLSFILILSRP